ncbi:MAG: UDP-3-O-(3-hydroxymyristoyl)glucosamine N-acyltransferase [Candidatus Aminicenantales bacterium]
MKLKELAARLNCTYEGDGEVEIRRVASLETATEGDLSFLSHPRFRRLLSQTRASALILAPDIPVEGKNVIRSVNPQLSFIQAAELLHPATRPIPGIDASAYVSPTATLGEGVTISAGCVIGANVVIGARTIIHPLVVIYPEVTIGEDCEIHAHVSIRERTLVGNRVIIHNGAVIGADGFGYVQTSEGEHRKIPQLGRVVIEDDVEIGANTTIDRAALGETRIGRGTKIDNLVQVAHNVQIGPHSILAGQVGIAGSTKIGQRVIMGGQVGIADHIEIGDRVLIAAKSGVAKDIPPASFMAGIPAVDIREWRKVCVLLSKLEQMFKEVNRLRQMVEEREKKLKSE